MSTAASSAGSRSAVELPRPLSHLLSAAIVTVVGILLVHVLFETWAQDLTGPTSDDPLAELDNTAQWPKQLTNLLYLGLAALTMLKVAIDRLWKRFRTAADLALLVLGLVMVLAGVVNDSAPSLMGQAVFVYFRDVLVFYALRAADLRPAMIRRLLLVVAAVVGLNLFLALVQAVVGPPAYRALGWTDLTWADQSRAQGLQSHPNHLGHLLGLTILGFMAWAAVQQRVRRGWWAVAAVVALALSATQSLESLLGVLVAGVLIAVLVRGSARRVLAVCLIVVLCTAAQIAVQPDHRAEWERRLGNALPGGHHPAGSEQRPATPVREIRVLYLQQAADILPRQPLLGFGLGQFGGVVAEKHDPDWHRNPKFGPNGFNRYGVQDVQIESFWLHLVMEVGVLGGIAFVVWLFFVVRPLVRATRRGRRRTRQPPAPSATVVWAIGAMVFAAVVALFSPAFEDPLFPALLWTVLGLAWWAWRRSREEAASLHSAPTAMLPVVRDPSDVREADTRILDTDEILALARRARALRGRS
ncbi:MAG: O-antigen ligase family protein [Micromonospora sp.]